MKNQTKTREVEIFELPAYWACALINNDFEGLSEWDEEKIKDFFNDNPGLYCVGCSEESFFSTYRGMGCDMIEYTFLS